MSVFVDAPINIQFFLLLLFWFNFSNKTYQTLNPEQGRVLNPRTENGYIFIDRFLYGMRAFLVVSSFQNHFAIIV